jgi:hypothetical protein
MALKMQIPLIKELNKTRRHHMKKVLVFALALLITAAFGSMAFAQDLQSPGTEMQAAMAKAKAVKFEGTVLSHDVKCHCVVVKTAKGNLTLQDDYAKFDGEYNRATGLKIGSKVKGEYKTVMYINYALSFSGASE